MQFSQTLITALKAVSGEILPDLYEADPEGCNDPELVAEATIDADRLARAGFAGADARVRIYRVAKQKHDAA